MTLKADVFPKLRGPKNVIRKMSNNRVLGDPSTHNVVNGWKHCCNLSDSSFPIFINHCEGNCVGKSIF